MVDLDAVERLERSLDAEGDPIAKLRILSELRQAKQADHDALHQQFCLYAKDWADANGIPVDSFLELGVDADTLRAAGFKLADSPSPRARKDSRDHKSGSHPVPVANVKDIVARKRGVFTLAHIAEASGASPMTVRKAINELITSGDVERLGPTPGWSQPGRAPIQFRRVR